MRNEVPLCVIPTIQTKSVLKMQLPAYADKINSEIKGAVCPLCPPSSYTIQFWSGTCELW